MGVDMVISLPANVQIRDVAKAIGKLMGLPSFMEELSGSSGGLYVKVDDVEIKTSQAFSDIVSIDIGGKGKSLVDGYDERLFFYDFEGTSGRRHIRTRSYAVNIALGRRLVDFFGGWVNYCDYNDNKDYVVPDKSDEENCPEDGEPWQAFQDRIHALGPITKAEIKECKQWAAYKD